MVLLVSSFSDRSSLERNYLQRSIIPSYYFQKSLPRLPLPLLEKTSDRFLKALTQLVNVEQLAATTNVVEKFQLNEGRGRQHCFSNASNVSGMTICVYIYILFFFLGIL